MNIAFITKHPAPYRDQTLKEFSEFPNINLKVYNIQSISENHKEWNFTGNSINEYLKKPIKIPVFGDYNTDIISKISDADVIMVGSYYPTTNLVAILYAMKNNIPYVVCSDAIEDGRRFRLLKSFVVKRMWDRAKAFWVPGEMSRKYFISKGVSEEKIHCGYYVNDAKQMLKMIRRGADSDIAPELKNEIKNEITFLFVGKLIPSRCVNILLEAVKILELKYSFKVIIIGGGPDKHLVDDAKLQSKSIISIESVPYEQLHQYYGIVDAYIHPGAEPYSLATVEAVIAGIPVIATSKVGCTTDYLVDKKNGYYFDGSSKDLAAKMEQILLGNLDLTGVKDMQKFVLEKRSTEWAASELLSAVLDKDEKNEQSFYMRRKKISKD